MLRHLAAPRAAPALALMALALMAAVPVAACDTGGDDGGEPVELEPFECELVMAGGEGELVSLEGGGDAEMVLGFQGFLFVELFAAASGEDVPDDVDVTMSVTVGSADPFGGTQNGVDFEAADGDGVRTTEQILVFFSGGSTGDYVGLEAIVTMRLRGDTHECLTTATVTLVDDDPCVHTGEEAICPGDDGFEDAQ